MSLQSHPSPLQSLYSPVIQHSPVFQADPHWPLAAAQLHQKVHCQLSLALQSPVFRADPHWPLAAAQLHQKVLCQLSLALQSPVFQANPHWPLAAAQLHQKVHCQLSLALQSPVFRANPHWPLAALLNPQKVKHHQGFQQLAPQNHQNLLLCHPCRCKGMLNLFGKDWHWWFELLCTLHFFFS